MLMFFRYKLFIFVFIFVTGGMGPMNPRMNPPRGQNMSPLGSYSPGMRGPPPNTPLGPGGGGPNMPMSMGGLVGRPQWQPNTNAVSI